MLEVIRSTTECEKSTLCLVMKLENCFGKVGRWDIRKAEAYVK